jgi:hypothetical protein
MLIRFLFIFFKKKKLSFLILSKNAPDHSLCDQIRWRDGFYFPISRIKINFLEFFGLWNVDFFPRILISFSELGDFAE